MALSESPERSPRQAGSGVWPGSLALRCVAPCSACDPGARTCYSLRVCVGPSLHAPTALSPRLGAGAAQPASLLGSVSEGVPAPSSASSWRRRPGGRPGLWAQASAFPLRRIVVVQARTAMKPAPEAQRARGRRHLPRLRELVGAPEDGENGHPLGHSAALATPRCPQRPLPIPPSPCLPAAWHSHTCHGLLAFTAPKPETRWMGGAGAQWGAVWFVFLFVFGSETEREFIGSRKYTPKR